MTKYCRYCLHCIYGDVVYCEIKEETMSEKKAKSSNRCKSFDFTKDDVLQENVNGYQPRERKIKNGTSDNQLSLW